MKLKEIMAILSLAALWGASFLFIRIASPAIGPFLTIQSRVTIAGLILLFFMWMTKRSAHFRKYFWQYIIMGALNAAIPFMCIATAQLQLTASMGAILNSLTPLCTALIMWGWLKEALTIRKWLGIFMGMVGVLILVGWSPIVFTKDSIIAICFAILSTVSYAFGSVYTKKTFTGVSPLSLAVGQQIGASLLLLPFTFIYAPSSAMTASAAVVASVIGLAVLCTAIAYLLFFYLIEHVGPTKTVSVTFLIPLFGIIWGVIFLQEAISVSMIIGLIVILGSVFFLTDIPWSSKTMQENKLVG